MISLILGARVFSKDGFLLDRLRPNFGAPGRGALFSNHRPLPLALAFLLSLP